MGQKLHILMELTRHYNNYYTRNNRNVTFSFGIFSSSLSLFPRARIVFYYIIVVTMYAIMFLMKNTLRLHPKKKYSLKSNRVDTRLNRFFCSN